MKTLLSLIILVLLTSMRVNAQEITWSDVTSEYQLPNGVSLKKGIRTSPALQIWVLDADLNNENIAIRPYLSSSTLVPNHCSSNNAIAAINGGFFGGSTSYSTVIYPGEVKAQNVSPLTRNSLTYPVIRSMFSINKNFDPAVNWIYHFDNTLEGVYSYTTPLNYINNDPTPKATPLKTSGTPMANILVGIGGAPVLVKNGTKNITYNEEIMWGSGVGLTNNDPRTAVGYTANKHIIMVVADGRQTISEGVSLNELADIMLSFNCVEALNLDGGGSSGMAIGNQYVSSPSEQRAVPSILAITTRDKVAIPGEPSFEEIIDTENAKATKIGSWFETANAGFYGVSKSLLTEKGDGSNAYEYNTIPPANKYSEVYAWWVSSTNRAQNTPYIVKHKYNEETVLVDQTKNGSTWNYIGKFVFKGDGSDKITISNQATLGTYVVADAIKVISYGENEINTSVFNFHENELNLKCYPNPFGEQVNIELNYPRTQKLEVKVFDLSGQMIRMLYVGNSFTGTTLIWDGKNDEGAKMAPGSYLIRANNTVEKVVLSH